MQQRVKRNCPKKESTEVNNISPTFFFVQKRQFCMMTLQIKEILSKENKGWENDTVTIGKLKIYAAPNSIEPNSILSRGHEAKHNGLR